MEEVFNYLDENIKQEIQKYYLDKHDIEEIRLRTNKPIIQSILLRKIKSKDFFSCTKNKNRV